MDNNDLERPTKKVVERVVNYVRGVNVRRSPSATSEVLFVAPQGTAFVVKGIVDEWTRVVIPGDDRYGYIKTEFLSER